MHVARYRRGKLLRRLHTRLVQPFRRLVVSLQGALEIVAQSTGGLSARTNRIIFFDPQFLSNGHRLAFVPGGRTQGDPQRRRPDITKAQETLGWAPETPLEDGLAQAIAYFRQVMQ